MSGLGKTQENGETGSVTQLRHMPDQIPDNPGTIAATSSIENLMQLLYRNWIWQAQLQVDTTMLPGTVFGLFKIHPKLANYPNAHVARMFLTWTGSMKLRARFQATFQYGGSLRLGWLPPKFTRSQVNNLPVQVLTAYPNIDLDPKNTEFIEFQASEERNILFHWMDDGESDAPESFGGWFVFFVASPLVITGGGADNRVTMLVETAGSFEYAQPAPIDSIGPISNKGILDEDPIFTQTGCDDFQRIQAIQILSNKIKSLNAGWQFARAVNGKYTRDVVPNIVYSQAMKAWAESSGIVPFASSTMQVTEQSFGNRTFMIPSIATSQPIGNSEWDCVYAYFTDPSDYVCIPSPYKYITGSNLGFAFPEKGDPPASGKLGTIVFASDDVSPIKVADTGFYVINNNEFVADTSSMPILDGESLVTFVSMRTRSINIQTSLHADRIAKANLPMTTSQLYHLMTTDSTQPLLTVRLTPYGFFTCKSTDSDALLMNKNLYLRYIQDYPMNDPIPVTNNDRKFLMRAAMTTRRGYTGHKLDEHLWMHY